jgi:RNA polymerase sigma-70 factor (ECF subfamily)
MMSEQHIIDGCIRHNKKAQQTLWKQQSGYLLAVCMRYATDRPEAEDMLQEAFMKIFFSIGEYSGTGSFRGWMRKVTVNTAITYWHRNLKHKHQVDIDEYVSTETGTAGFEEDFYNAEDLCRVLAELSPGYRMIFNLYAIEGYMHHEIAEMLGIDVNTSKSQYSRARAILRKKLGDLAKMKGKFS